MTGTHDEVRIPYNAADTVGQFNIEVGGMEGFGLPDTPDIETVNRLGFPFYRGTPAGRIVLYNPATSNQFPSGCVLVGPSLPWPFFNQPAIGQCN